MNTIEINADYNTDTDNGNLNIKSDIAKAIDVYKALISIASTMLSTAIVAAAKDDTEEEFIKAKKVLFDDAMERVENQTFRKLIGMDEETSNAIRNKKK